MAAVGVRDLGYRPYEGARLPASRNTWVLFRHATARAWSSWFVKVAVLFGWIPPAVALVIFAVQSKFTTAAAAAAQAAPGAAPGTAAAALSPASVLRAAEGFQFWLVLSLITLGSGATAIARDMEFRAFRFYLAKPVEPWQYLAARVLGVAVWCFGILWVPAVFYLLGAAALTETPAHLGLVIPATLSAIVTSLSLGAASVGVSAASRSRGLTMSLWLVVLLVPHVLSKLVSAQTGSPWTELISLPALLGRVADALYRVGGEETGLDVRYAAPALALLVGGFTALAWHRVKHAEVIT